MGDNGKKPGGIAPIPAMMIGLAALALPHAAGFGQEPAPPPAGAAEGPPYRFLERYAAPKDEHKPAGAIGQYRVAFKQTIQVATDNPRGAPNREAFVRQVVCTERPAEISSVDPTQVISLVRRYDSYRATPDPRPRGTGPWPMDGLTLWYSARRGEIPKILSLAPDRALRDQDFAFANEQLFVPDLAAVLPSPLPARRGDTYQVTREATEILIDKAAEEGGLEGKLAEIRDEPKTGKRVAEFDVQGRVLTETGSDLSLNARIDFTFDPPPRAAVPAAPDAAKPEATAQARPIEVFGGITRLRMRVIETSPLGGPNDRLRRRVDRQLILERQLAPEGPELAVPTPAPTETSQNSWLTFIDPQQRFHFRHPQALLVQRSPEPRQIVLADGPAEQAVRRLVLVFEEKSRIPPDEIFQKVFEGARRAVKSGLATGGNQVLSWPGVRAQRREAVVKPDAAAGAAGDPPNQFDAYVIQFARDATLTATSTCPKDQAAAFRKDVEEILKSFLVGPPKGG